MKKFRTILFSALAFCAVMAVSCSKEENAMQEKRNATGTISVEVSGILGEYLQVDDTKSSLASNIRVKWAADDKVYAFDGAVCLGELTVSLKDGKDYYAHLSGNLDAPKEGTSKITLVYSNDESFNTMQQGDSVATVVIDLSSQTAQETPDNVKFVVYGTLDYTSGTPSLEDEVIEFTPATSILRLNCSGLEENAAITKASLIGAKDKCTICFSSEGGSPSVDGESPHGIIGLICNEFMAGDKGTQTIYVAVARNDTARNLVFEAKQEKTYEYGLGEKAFTAGKTYNAICPMKMLLPFTVSVNEDGTRNTVRFAPGNLRYVVESAKWEFYEHQYDFCNTTTFEGHHEDTISLFTWGYDATKSIAPDGKASDNVSITSGNLSQEQDWGCTIGDGNTWRTLTTEEWQYLFNTRTMTNGKDRYTLNITYGGKMGLVLYPDDYDNDPISGSVETMPEGVVFLPAAGTRYGSDVISGGRYWSSSADGGDGAFSVFFSRFDVSPGYYDDRYYGYSVRLITESN